MVGRLAVTFFLKLLKHVLAFSSQLRVVSSIMPRRLFLCIVGIRMMELHERTCSHRPPPLLYRTGAQQWRREVQNKMIAKYIGNDALILSTP